jgi:hypothetical protein
MFTAALSSAIGRSCRATRALCTAMLTRHLNASLMLRSCRGRSGGLVVRAGSSGLLSGHALLWAQASGNRVMLYSSVAKA